MLNRRLAVLSLIMIGLALALLYDSRSSEAPNSAEPASTPTPRQRQASSARQSEPPDILDIRARKGLSEVRDAFSTRSWTPHPVAPAITKPAAAELPPLPFRYLGKQVKSGQLTLFLTDSQQTYIALPGAVLDEIYQITRLESHEITMKHLPSGKTQILSIGSE